MVFNRCSGRNSNDYRDYRSMGRDKHMSKEIKDYKDRIDYDLWKDVIHVDPDKRPWTYDCEGNKIVKTEDGEPDYTKRWDEYKV